VLYTIQEIGAEGLQPGEARLDSNESGARGLEYNDLLGLDTCAMKCLPVFLLESRAEGLQPGDIPGSQQGGSARIQEFRDELS
jgi:hypothetical protein